MMKKQRIKVFLITTAVFICVSPVSAASYNVGSEMQLNTYTTGNQNYTSVASNGNGYLVTWQSGEQDGDDSGVFGRRIDSAGNTQGT